MDLVTRKTQAKSVHERWRKQNGSKRPESIELKDLGEDPDPDEVDRILGNDTWTCVPSCTECGHVVDTVVHIGDDWIDGEHVHICKDCLDKARALFHADGTCDLCKAVVTTFDVVSQHVCRSCITHIYSEICKLPWDESTQETCSSN